MIFGCGRIIGTSSSSALRAADGQLGFEHRLQLALDPPHRLRRTARARAADSSASASSTVRSAICARLHLDQVRLGGQVQPVDAPVGGVGPAHHPALLLHAVDHAAGGRLLDLQHLGQFRLGRAGPAMQPVDHQPLRAGQAEAGAPAGRTRCASAARRRRSESRYGARLRTDKGLPSVQVSRLSLPSIPSRWRNSSMQAMLMTAMLPTAGRIPTDAWRAG